MTQTWITTAAVLALTSHLLGCDRGPTADDARETYAKHEPTVDAIDRRLRKEVKALPGLGEVSSKCPEPAPWDAIDTCQEVTGGLRRMRSRALATLRRDAVDYLDYPNVIGLEVTYTSVEDPRPQTLLDVGLTPGGVMPGHVEASRGVEVDGLQVGWGRFQTAYRIGDGPSYGDGVGRLGIEVEWAFEEHGKRLRVQLWILADHHPPDPWRDGYRAPKKE